MKPKNYLKVINLTRKLVNHFYHRQHLKHYVNIK